MEKTTNQYYSTYSTLTDMNPILNSSSNLESIVHTMHTDEFHGVVDIPEDNKSFPVSGKCQIDIYTKTENNVPEYRDVRIVDCKGGTYFKRYRYIWNNLSHYRLGEVYKEYFSYNVTEPILAESDIVFKSEFGYAVIHADEDMEIDRIETSICKGQTEVVFELYKGEEFTTYTCELLDESCGLTDGICCNACDYFGSCAGDNYGDGDINKLIHHVYGTQTIDKLTDDELVYASTINDESDVCTEDIITLLRHTYGEQATAMHHDQINELYTKSCNTESVLDTLLKHIMDESNEIPDDIETILDHSIPTIYTVGVTDPEMVTLLTDEKYCVAVNVDGVDKFAAFYLYEELRYEDGAFLEIYNTGKEIRVLTFNGTEYIEVYNVLEDEVTGTLITPVESSTFVKAATIAHNMYRWVEASCWMTMTVPISDENRMYLSQETFTKNIPTLDYSTEVSVPADDETTVQLSMNLDTDVLIDRFCKLNLSIATSVDTSLTSLKYDLSVEYLNPKTSEFEKISRSNMIFTTDYSVSDGICMVDMSTLFDVVSPMILKKDTPVLINLTITRLDSLGDNITLNIYSKSNDIYSIAVFDDGNDFVDAHNIQFSSSVASIGNTVHDAIEYLIAHGGSGGGGVVSIDIDKTLSVSGKAADAKVVGDKLKKIETEGVGKINDINLVGDLTSTDDLKVPGKIVSGQEFTVDGEAVIAKDGAEVFNNYETNIATGLYAHVEGNSNYATGDFSHAEGNSNRATGIYSHAEGCGSIASGHTSHVEGTANRAEGMFSHAEGTGSHAIGLAAHAEGHVGNAYGQGCHAEGNMTTAGTMTTDSDGKVTYGGYYAHSEGNKTTASGEASHAEGNNTTASGDGSHAEGYFAVKNSTNVYNNAYTAGSHVEGCGTTAGLKTENADGTITYSGDAAHAEGYLTSATGKASHAEGESTIASGQSSHAEGAGTTAFGQSSHAEGAGTTASGQFSHAEGAGTTASGQFSHAEGGNGTTASGMFSHAEGSGAQALGTTSHAEGSGTRAHGYNSHAEGGGTNAYGTNSHAEGTSTNAYGNNSHAEGGGTIAGTSTTNNGVTTYSGDYAHAEGNGSKALGIASHAEGASTTAYGKQSHAEGNSTTASGDYSHAEGGFNTLASGIYAHAEGKLTTSSGEASHSEGGGTKATATYAHAEGRDTTSSAEATHTEGYLSKAFSNYAHAEGNDTKAYGKGSHAEGNKTTAGSSTTNGGVTTYSGDYSHAEGENTIASGYASHAEGGNSLAIAQYSHAEGSPAYSYGAAGSIVAQPTAYSRGSHAEGVGSIAGVQNGVGTAGWGAHAEGYTTTASGEGAHSEGIGTVASGYGAHAEGRDTIASSNCQHVQGKYNVEDNNDTFAFIIGNGESNGDRSNAFAVDWNGNIYVNNSETGVSVLDLLNRIKTLEDAIASNKVLLTDDTTGTIYQFGINNGTTYFTEYVENEG